MNIQNSVAFVTGANRGLGLAFAKALLARGAKKVYAGVRNPAAFNVAGIIPVRLDVTDAASVAAAAAQCGDVTLLVNNAGIAELSPSALAEDFISISERILDTNYHGVVRATQAFAPVIKHNGGGAIVNVLSNATWFTPPIISAYSATKAAAWSYTNALRLEVRDQGIQVLGLHVGWLDTDMTAGVVVEKTAPALVAERTLDGLVAGKEEVLADEGTQQIKKTLSSDTPCYLQPAGFV